MSASQLLKQQFGAQFGISPNREPEKPVNPPERPEPDLALAVAAANELVRDDKDWKDELISKLLLNLDGPAIEQMVDHYFKTHVMDAGTVFGIEVEKAIYELALENINTFGVKGAA